MFVRCLGVSVGLKNRSRAFIGRLQGACRAFAERRLPGVALGYRYWGHVYAHAHSHAHAKRGEGMANSPPLTRCPVVYRYNSQI